MGDKKYHRWTSVYKQSGTTFVGDTVIAKSAEEAQKFLDTSDRGHMKVDGKLVADIPITDSELNNIVKNLKKDGQSRK